MARVARSSGACALWFGWLETEQALEAIHERSLPSPGISGFHQKIRHAATEGTPPMPRRRALAGTAF